MSVWLPRDLLPLIGYADGLRLYTPHDFSRVSWLNPLFINSQSYSLQNNLHTVKRSVLCF